jgi:hypothetical protein
VQNTPAVMRPEGLTHTRDAMRTPAELGSFVVQQRRLIVSGEYWIFSCAVRVGRWRAGHLFPPFEFDGGMARRRGITKLTSSPPLGETHCPSSSDVVDPGT